jgi:shikimate kinase
MRGTQGNIILIGMPGAGKSTLGVLLAKALGYDFLDTDVMIQAHEGRLLQEILDAEGPDGFCELEARYLSELAVDRCVVATGGSVVYSAATMRHLKSSGVTVYLQLSLPDLLPRLDNLDIRGVVMRAGQTLSDLYRERVPLYERYTDLTIPCGGDDHEAIVGHIVAELARFTPGAPVEQRLH